MVNTTGLFREKVTTESTDDAAPVTTGQVYDSSQVASVQLPNTVGPWLDIDGIEYDQNSLQVVIKPGGGVISAADPITVAEFAQLKGGQGRVGDGTVAGPVVEREVITRNRNQTVVFGDLHFMVPSSGGSSLQMRRGSAPSMTITHFSTFWSNQQGGASEQAPTFTVSTSWRHFRQVGLNLTQHNNYQEGSFVCNGWLYKIQVIVGLSWNNNRFSCTRWRLDGIKGDPGTDGIDGADAASIDHVSLTAGDGSPGTTDTYTLWADAGETVSLGTYDVPIPAAVGGIQTVELASYAGASTNGRTLTLAGGRTWQDVLDEFQFVYVIAGGNSLFTHDQSRQWHVSDLDTPNRDMAITDYQTHGSNSYHYKMRCPFGTSTTVLIDNDGSSMSVQRIKVIGVK